MGNGATPPSSKDEQMNHDFQEEIVVVDNACPSRPLRKIEDLNLDRAEFPAPMVIVNERAPQVGFLLFYPEEMKVQKRQKVNKEEEFTRLLQTKLQIVYEQQKEAERIMLLMGTSTLPEKPEYPEKS